MIFPVSFSRIIGRYSSLAVFVLSTLSFLQVTQTAEAADSPKTGDRSASERRLGYQFQLENDVLARERTDRWYTNGLRFSVTIARPDAQLDPVARWLLDKTAGFSLGDDVQVAAATKLVTYSVGQNMYTPRRIDISSPQIHDRPWAGWLYGGITVQGYVANGGVGGAGEFQQSDLKIGVTGHASGAGQVQRWFHESIGSQYPAGWEQQLKQQAGLQLSHMRIYRFGDSAKRDWVGLHAGGGATLGTLRSYATAVAGVIVGSLKGTNPVFVPANEGDFVIQDFDKRPARDRWLVFANVSLTGVASNRFITGSTPYGHSDVRLRRIVPAWQWGLAFPMPFTESWRVVYTQNARQAEFDSPSVGARESLQRWGSVTLTRDFE